MNRSESKYFNSAVRMDEALLGLLGEKDFDYITVKEICERAGVNRSTFYLHYETVADLLSECVLYTNRRCFGIYGEKYDGMKERISSAEPEELIFITPEYLRPYLEFVSENKRLFRVVLTHPRLMEAEITFEELFRSVFSPIMDRFHCAQEEKQYIIAFYIEGLMAIVSRWLKNDCAEPVENIIGICMNCVLPQRDIA